MELSNINCVKLAIGNASVRPEFQGGNWKVKMALVYDDLCRQIACDLDKANGDYDEVVNLCRVIRDVKDNELAIAEAKKWL